VESVEIRSLHGRKVPLRSPALNRYHDVISGK